MSDRHEEPVIITIAVFALISGLIVCAYECANVQNPVAAVYAATTALFAGIYLSSKS